MTDITKLAQRKKFEAWAHSQKLSLAYGYCGYAFSSTEMAWRAWMASSAELVEALEKAQAENTAGVAGMAESYETTISMLRSRIAELESRTVKLPHRNLGHDKLFLLCPFPYYDAEDMEKALADAGIKVEAE